MENEKVYCPYCGPWNGHPDGVEMGLCNLIFGTDNWYRCPECESLSPMRPTDEEAHAAALHRFTPPQKPLTYEEVRERAAESAPIYALPAVGNGQWMTAVAKEGETEEGYNYPGGMDFDALDVFGYELDGDFYGLRGPDGLPHCLGWIAFDHKPTDQEIKAADWRNNDA